MDRKRDDAPLLTDEQRHKKLRDEGFNAWLEKNSGSYSSWAALLGFETAYTFRSSCV